MRNLVRGIINETYKVTSKAPDAAERQNIKDQLRPWKQRFDFSQLDVGMPEDITFEIYVYFRSFYNPQIE